MDERHSNDLLGFTTEDLYAEVVRREDAHRDGKCDACGAWYDEPACLSLRHRDAEEDWVGRWKLEYRSNWLDACFGKVARVKVHRHGAHVRLTSWEGYRKLAETELPDASMSDRERLEWAIAWAEEELGNNPEAVGVIDSDG